MAQYPSIQYTKDSSIELLDGREVYRAGNGKARAHVMWDETKVRLVLQHVAVTLTERDEIVNHYLAHKEEVFPVVFEGAIYNVVYMVTPKMTPLGASLWTVVSEVEEV